MGNLFKKTAAALAVAVAALAVDVPVTITAEAAGGCEGNHSVDLNTVDLTGEPAALSDGYYYLTADLTLSKEVEIDGNVTICLNGQNISADGSSRVLFVKNGASFTLCDCKEKGKITGGSEEKGGGVFVDNGGTFIMEGGIISGNTATHQGGGVFVSNGGTFTMTGGTISQNTVTKTSEDSGGGGVYTAGVFTMDGGAISGNTADNCYGGVVVSGSNAIFNLNNGTISENKAKEWYGGGVHVSSSGKVYMVGGTIRNNEATNGGGGVSVGGGAFEMTGGTISSNTARYGGGTYLSAGSFTMSNSGSISSNTATGEGGGGLYLGGGNFNMDGGAMSNNKATGTGSGGNGGAVYLAMGKLTMTGGEITNNTANNFGSCVYMDNANGGGTLLLDGPVKITSGTNSNVYLKHNKTITIGNSFSVTDKIGIHPEDTPNCEILVPATTFAGGVTHTDISDKFKADLPTQTIVYDSNQVKLRGEHSYDANAEWLYNSEYHWHDCNVCNAAEAGKAAHRWDNGTIIRQPTAAAAGEIKYVCLDCAYPKTEPLPYRAPSATGGNRTHDDEDNSVKSASSNPPTGIALAIAPAALAAVGLAVAITRKRR